MLDRRRLLLLAVTSALFVSGCQTMPPGNADRLYDTHSHFFSNDVARYPIDTTGAHEGAEVLRNRIMTTPSTPDHILQLWAANHVEGGVGVQYNSAYKTNNSYLLDSAAAHPDRISAVVILDARKPDTLSKLRELVTQRGVSGLRLTGYPDKAGNYPWLDSDEALATWAEADRLGTAIVLMYLPTVSNASALDHIARLAARFPNVKIVLDHVGWPAIVGAPDFGLTPAHVALKAYPNVFFKLTTINLDNLDSGHVSASGFLRHAVDVFGANRLMWGSDYGNTPGEFADMVHRIEAATTTLTPAERRQVLHDTGKAVFGRKAHR